MTTLGYFKTFLSGPLKGIKVECRLRVDATSADQTTIRLYGVRRDLITGSLYRTDRVWTIK